MEIINIKESGSNSTLLWAIANGGNPKQDEQLTSIVNDELFYLVTFSDVNFLELFRLTQMYREKLRIVNEYQAAIPARKILTELFSGTYKPDEENEPDRESPLYEIVEQTLQLFMDIVTQMDGDNDIISPRAKRLFIPMLCRRFDVQIPVGFFDFVSSLTDQEASKLFNADYPNTIQSEIIDAEVHSVKNILKMAFVRSTTILKYNPRYNQYMKMVKYAPLKRAEDDKLYKFGLLGFHKYDNITRGEVRVTFSPTAPSKDNLISSLQRLSKLSTPLIVDFAVSLPLQYMQTLLNSYDRNTLSVKYESPMSVIIDSGLVYNDFITPEIDPETEDPYEQEKLQEFNNQVSAYRQRIADTNLVMMNVLGILLNHQFDIDVTAAFAMIPSVYHEKAVISIDLSKTSEYENHHDPVISEMFKSMLDMASSILADINRSK